MLAREARVLMAADVIPGPAIEAAGFDMRDVLRHQVVSQSVAFVHAAPEFAGHGIHAQAHWVANATGVNTHELALRTVFEDVRPMGFSGVRVRVVYVTARAD